MPDLKHVQVGDAVALYHKDSLQRKAFVEETSRYSVRLQGESRRFSRRTGEEDDCDESWPDRLEPWVLRHEAELLAVERDKQVSGMRNRLIYAPWGALTADQVVSAVAALELVGVLPPVCTWPVRDGAGLAGGPDKSMDLAKAA